MTKSHKYFPNLVVAFAAVYTLYNLLPYALADGPIQSPDATIIFAGIDTIVVFPNWFWNCYFFLTMVACFGLINFKNWGRHIFLGTTVFGVLHALFSGGAVMYSFDYTLFYVNTLLEGGILVLAYTNLSAVFRNAA